MDGLDHRNPEFFKDGIYGGREEREYVMNMRNVRAFFLKELRKGVSRDEIVRYLQKSKSFAPEGVFSNLAALCCVGKYNVPG